MIAAGPGTAAARGAIRQAAKIVGFLSNTGMLGVVFFNQAILSVLAGPKFAGFGGILLAFCLLGWLYWFQSFFLSVLYATSPPKRFLQFSAICIVSSLALSITMGWHFGISGFLLGRVAAAAILIGFGGYLTLRDGNVLDSELRLLEKSLVGVVLLCALAFFGRPLLSVRHVFACVAGVIVYYATVHDILFQMASLVFPKVAAAGEERLSIAYGTAIVSADPEAGSSLSVTAK
jgi:O-antigen/teichoic acid export membrane protein